MKRTYIRTLAATFCIIMAALFLNRFYFVNYGQSKAVQRLREGDIVFITSDSRQAPYIARATKSRYTHCGVVVMVDKKPYVLEASNVVKLTPAIEFIRRDRYPSSSIRFRRVLDKDKNVKIKYKQYLGMPYDLAFRFDNGKMYCSELVWVIYKDQFGIELCSPRPVSSYNLAGVSDIMKRRGIDRKQKVVAPSDLWKTKVKNR